MLGLHSESCFTVSVTETYVGYVKEFIKLRAGKMEVFSDGY